MQDITNDIIYKFDHDLLVIDISVEQNPEIYKTCEELGPLLDEVSDCEPYTDESWDEYLRSRVGEWHYMRVHKSNGRVVGTASDEDPGEKEVLLAQEFIDAVNGAYHEITEGFDAVLD